MEAVVGELESLKQEKSRVEKDLDRSLLFQQLRERNMNKVQHSLNNSIQSLILSIDAMKNLMKATSEAGFPEEDEENIVELEGEKTEHIFLLQNRLAEFGSMVGFARSALEVLQVEACNLGDAASINPQTEL